jgi:hypothetical protein
MTALAVGNLRGRPDSANSANATGTTPIDDSEDGLEKAVKPKLRDWSRRPSLPESQNDRLDAFMAAWVASLPSERRRAFGDATRPDDAIWVPS